MAVRGVMFDLGGTLLHYNAPNTWWEDTEKTGARGIYRSLRERGYVLLPEDEALPAAWDHALALWSTLTQGNHNVRNLKLDHFTRTLAARWGIDGLAEDTVTALSQAYMTAIQALVYPLNGAAETLRALRQQGYRLGLISNTIWPGSAHIADLGRFGLTPYLERLTFSGDAEAWKPFGEVFQLGLDALDLQPDQAIFVGDSLYFDVWGAQQAGMRGVWIEQPRAWLPEGMEVTPDATITALPDLLPLVDEWQNP